LAGLAIPPPTPPRGDLGLAFAKQIIGVAKATQTIAGLRRLIGVCYDARIQTKACPKGLPAFAQCLALNKRYAKTN